ncbi:hypothetical protein BUALT_Bualt16G0080000 [Buddleja alternifolia]|uniref:FAD-binding PCMH-type domain-containing protein n=1 Tax=Buddleja alternifolia TaxID=168488 RepID=A0AAV6WHR3_9LAMI|nr:hypothetical protein BUALT_Bualt16G0080000 [Buddleja alternifolia]
MSDITIDIARKTAFVQAGATLGQLYYKINEESKTLAFPAGECPTVGVSGHFSGGGYGSLSQKHGLAADNIIDARIIDVNGRILDRKAMGEELFWAIRGGGGGSFGVITAWQLKLVTVPEIVTVFSIDRTLEQNATELVHRWQYVAPNLPEDIALPIFVRRGKTSETRDKVILANFVAVFLGRVDSLLELFEREFPELGVGRGDCSEVSWIQSALFVASYPIDASPEVLASRVSWEKPHFKGKSDYVQKPISKNGLKGIWEVFPEKEAGFGQMILSPYGGKMKEISESAIAFPHRGDNLYGIQYVVYWNEPGEEASKRYTNWIRKLYNYMTPYVSKSPRAAYINYRDLDLGVNNEDSTSYEQARSWGLKYFKNNFDRLVRIKTMVDPSNFFKHEQSIPTVYLLRLWFLPPRCFSKRHRLRQAQVTASKLVFFYGCIPVATVFSGHHLSPERTTVNRALVLSMNLAKPCIIFMDEIDAIGGCRFSEGTTADREIQRNLMELLNQLDGFVPFLL